MTPSEIRRLVQRKLKALEHVLKAVVHCQAAHALAIDLPAREADPDKHDTQVATMHGVVRAARSNLEAHFRRSMRRLRNSGSGPSGPSGTDADAAYDTAPGDDLGRATEAISKADAEADRIVEAVGDDAAVDAVANDMHPHLKEADAALERYRAAVVDNPEGKARREISRAFARTVLRGYGAGHA